MLDPERTLKNMTVAFKCDRDEWTMLQELANRGREPMSAVLRRALRNEYERTGKARKR